MHRVLNIWFTRLAGLLLLVTGLGKLISSTGNAIILIEPDPIIGMPIRTLLFTAGVIECIAGLTCVLGLRLDLSAGILGWVAGNLLLYRVGIKVIGYNEPCGCLGNLTEALHLPLRTADTIAEIILSYLICCCLSNGLYFLTQKYSPFLAKAHSPVPQ